MHSAINHLRAAALLEAAPGPSPLLDQIAARLGDTPGSPTSSLDTAAALVEAALPGVTWSVKGSAAGAEATIVTFNGSPSAHTATGSTPALALLAAAIRANHLGKID